MTTPVLAAPAVPPTEPALPSATRLAIGDTLPLAAAVLPFGLAIGATIADSELWAPGALAGALLLMAGASQLAVVGLLNSGAGIAVAVGTALLINARFILYSAGLARWFRQEPLWRRMLLAIPLVDQSFLLGQQRFEGDQPEAADVEWRRRYYLTVSAMLLAVFVPGQLVGFAVGSSLPEGAGLSMAAPLAFAGMLAMACKTVPAAVAAATGGIAVVVVAGLPSGLSLPVAALVGVAAGSVVEERS